MPDAVAVNIIVFGRGLVFAECGVELTPASAERVEALTDYVEENSAAFSAHRGKIVFSGGWAGAAEGIERPLEQFREGKLMLDQAEIRRIVSSSLDSYADLYAEIDSDSTLENALRTREIGYFEGVSFSTCNPLGLVAHHDHMARAEYLVRKAFGISPDAIIHIFAPGGNRVDSLRERIVLCIFRLAFLGVKGDDSLRRRHGMLVYCYHQLRRSHPRAGKAQRRGRS